MIRRAGNALRSLELHDASTDDELSTESDVSSMLTSSCLSSLSWNDGAPGSRLRRLCLHFIERMENTPLLASLSVCPSLVDLEILGLDVDLGLTLDSVSKHCPLLEHLSIDNCRTGVGDGPKESIYHEFVLNCPNLTSLALEGFKLDDYVACILMKGFHKLEHVNFSSSYGLTGSFLKNLGTNGDGKHLEVMVLRDCKHLEEVEIKQFIAAVLVGDHLRLLTHLDISNENGLVSADDDKYTRCITTSFIPTKQLLEQRPNFCLLAKFPDSYSEIEQTTSDSSDYSEESIIDEDSSSEESTGYSSEFSEESSRYESGSEESNFEANEENADEQRNI